MSSRAQKQSIGQKKQLAKDSVDVAARLHIVQGGIENGDWDRLKKLGESSGQFESWIVPKAICTGDDVVIFVRGLGFVATAKALSGAKKRKDWHNRYGAKLGSVRLITPPVSLAYVQSRIPSLTWAIYPRSITTPAFAVAKEIRELIAERRALGVTLLRGDNLTKANLGELRVLALKGASNKLKVIRSEQQRRIRADAIRRYALARSAGDCECCEEPAPFKTVEGEPFLEVHHILQVSDDGPDRPDNVIALCPNCHRRAHYANDKEDFKSRLLKRVSRLEPSAKARKKSP